MAPRDRENCAMFETSADDKKFIRVTLDKKYYIEAVHGISQPYAESGNCM